MAVAMSAHTALYYLISARGLRFLSLIGGENVCSDFEMRNLEFKDTDGMKGERASQERGNPRSRS
jgi:hypothetical protein